MSTIALTLHEPTARRVRDVWDVLEAGVGVKGIRKVPFPHMTLFGCEGIAHSALEPMVEEVTAKTPPLQLRTVGLGLFLRPQPVFYAPIIRSPQLADLHQRLWNEAGTLGGRLFGLYAPNRWVPHMTLAQGDLQPDDLARVFSALVSLDLELEFEVRNITIYDWIGPRYEPRDRYPLLGQEVDRSDETVR
jgi:2'-5' RNA ligase